MDTIDGSDPEFQQVLQNTIDGSLFVLPRAPRSHEGSKRPYLAVKGERRAKAKRAKAARRRNRSKK